MRSLIVEPYLVPKRQSRRSRPTEEDMKIWMTVVATLSSAAVGDASAQNGGMMSGDHGGMWGNGWMGGYGGFWVPILLVVVVGLVVWIVMQKRK
jgi:predicted lipid-binding transport protein (Tim44 family)